MVEVERELEFEFRWEVGLGREEGEGRDCSAPILKGVVVFRRVEFLACSWVSLKERIEKVALGTR